MIKTSRYEYTAIELEIGTSQGVLKDDCGERNGLDPGWDLVTTHRVRQEPTFLGVFRRRVNADEKVAPVKSDAKTAGVVITDEIIEAALADLDTHAEMLRDELRRFLDNPAANFSTPHTTIFEGSNCSITAQWNTHIPRIFVFAWCVKFASGAVVDCHDNGAYLSLDCSGYNSTRNRLRCMSYALARWEATRQQLRAHVRTACSLVRFGAARVLDHTTGDET